MPALLFLIIFPLLSSALAFLVRRFSKLAALILSVFPLLLLLLGGTRFIGAEYNAPWLPTLSIHFHLAVDNLSLVFLYLANVIVPLSLLATSARPLERANFFYGFILLLQALLNGFFTSQDLVCFTFFFEAILLPLYFLINTWGGVDRERASFKFIIYMVAGSALMVASVLALYLAAGSFDLAVLAKISNTLPHASLLAAIFLLAFAVKTPLFPFHAWLPDSYCQAPVPGTILLSAVLSKAGVYGLWRVSIGLFPTVMLAWSPWLLALAITGVLYGAFAAWGQRDFKRLIAYSSFSHVNFILAGVFVWNQFAQGGAILQAVNHSITIAGLFLVAGWLEVRLSTTQFGEVSGLATYLPRLCWITLFFVLSAVALPGLNNFVSEVMLLYGVFIHNWWLSALLGTTVVLSVIYMLRFMHAIYFSTASVFRSSWLDLSAKESIYALPFVALIIWLGLYPATILEQIEPAALKILEAIK